MSKSSELSVIILAAGKGTRMNSSLPKVLHTIAGKTMVQYVIDAVTPLVAARLYIVYGYGGELLQQQLANKQKKQLNWVLQAEQRGTGHAIQQTLPAIRDEEQVLIIYGDVPLISTNTIERLLASYPDGGIGLLTVTLAQPHGYGRIVYINGEVAGIVEQQDQDAATNKQQYEINAGILVAKGYDLKRWLSNLTNHNAQGEFYLTEIIAMAWNEGRPINTVQPDNLHEVNGVNNRLQLAQLERISQIEKAEQLLLAGVMIYDPERFDLRGELRYGQDVSIDTNVILEGLVILGNRVVIGTGCVLKNAVIGDDVVILPYTVIEESRLEAQNTVGPFARLRPGTQLEAGANVGNFVEMKQARLGNGSKVGHLSYIGDADIGATVNIGAGTITCNYDGANKHQTIIGNDVFIGSDSQLVAPITIGTGATIGAGTTVTCDVAEDEMIISRIRQFPIPNWKRPLKK